MWSIGRTRAASIVSGDRSWITSRGANPRAQFRLFCFPYGGAGASIFRAWPRALAEEVEVCAVRLPGRESRRNEAPYTSIRALVDELADVLRPMMDVPFALFGHSLGAFVAFELARQLRRNNGPAPACLLLSGQRAPHLPDPQPLLYRLPDTAFVDGIRQRYDAIPQAVVDTPGLLQALLPVLRADFTMNDTYCYTDDEPLDCPITCFGGFDDHEARPEELEAWSEQTRSSFTLELFPGGHFFLHRDEAAVLQAVSRQLELVTGRVT